MLNTIKEAFKKQLYTKSKEELVDLLSDIYAVITANANIQGLQNIQVCEQRAIDAINANFKELTKNEIDTSVSPLTAKIREGEI